MKKMSVMNCQPKNCSTCPFKRRQMQNHSNINKPVGHCLNEEWLVLSHSPAPRFLCSVVHSKHIITINTNGQHAITRTTSSCSWKRTRGVWIRAAGTSIRQQQKSGRKITFSLTDAITSVLFVCRGRDGVAIVAAKKYQWALKGGREVEAGVCIPFASCSFSKIANDSTVYVLSLDCIRSSSRWKRHRGINIYLQLCVCLSCFRQQR